MSNVIGLVGFYEYLQIETHNTNIIIQHKEGWSEGHSHLKDDKGQLKLNLTKTELKDRTIKFLDDWHWNILDS